MSHQSDSKSISLQIPSDIKYIKDVSSKILEWLESRKLDESTLFDIRLCVEETVRNAITHGNNNDKSLKVLISYWFEDNGLIVEIEDQGNGFDPDKVPDPTGGDNIMRGGGRGVYLVRKLMDKTEYNDKGNKVRLTKYF